MAVSAWADFPGSWSAWAPGSGGWFAPIEALSPAAPRTSAITARPGKGFSRLNPAYDTERNKAEMGQAGIPFLTGPDIDPSQSLNVAPSLEIASNNVSTLIILVVAGVLIFAITRAGR